MATITVLFVPPVIETYFITGRKKPAPDSSELMGSSDQAHDSQPAKQDEVWNKT